jgi:dipeptidyl aminopeptidase/acylaminoacyl peptidase
MLIRPLETAVRCSMLLILLAIASPLRAAEPSQEVQTVAEKSGYTATSRHADVAAFCESITRPGSLATLSNFGVSAEGRKLPLLVIADPPISTPSEARETDKLIVLAMANIHAGEVDGKEALLALARELAHKKGDPLLKDLIILIVPILNADGNERIDRNNRPKENGPSQGAGIRENAQGLDLNRDFVKLETPEVRALLKLLDTWNPAVVIDCHTTNGSKHRFTLTYDGPRYPSAPEVEKWTSATMLPEVRRIVKETTGFATGPYGNFSADRTRWETYPALPRYGVQYLALRNRIGILSESYSYATFKDRVLATKVFVQACFAVAASHKKTIRAFLNEPPATERVVLRTRTVAHPYKVSIPGFEETLVDGKRVSSDKPWTYELDWHSRVIAEHAATRPHAYLIPPAFEKAIDTLRRHGITVRELREDITLDVESYTIDTLERSQQPFQKQHLWTLTALAKPTQRKIPAGTVVVPTNQPLGTLAAYLCEPEAEDGLATWGFFADGTKPGGEFPVLRLPKMHPLTLGSLGPLAEDRAAQQRFTEQVYMTHGGFEGSPTTTGDWLDGEHFLQYKEGKLWSVEARTGKAVPFTKPERIAASVKAIEGFSDRDIQAIASGSSFRMNPTRTGFLLDIASDLAIAYFDGTPGVRLTRSPAGKRHTTFSPTGRHLAFVRDGNLFSVSVQGAVERQLTTDGGGDISSGKCDWIYEEEVFNRGGKAYWWSPDGKQIAFMRFDDSPVRRFHIVDQTQVNSKLESLAYPKAGDPNPEVKVGVVDVADGKPVWLDLGTYRPADIIISRVGWMPGSRGVYAYIQNRTQTWLDVVVWDSPMAKPRKLHRETTRAWVEDTGPLHFFADGSFLMASESSGWKHLYRVDATGELWTPITRGEWDVHDVLRVDPDGKEIYFTAALTSPTGVDLCRIVPGAEQPELLTEKGRTHTVDLAPQGPLFIDRTSDSQTPPQVALREAGKGTVRMLDTNPVRERKGFELGRYERVKVPMKDGFQLEGSVTYPPGFDREKKYPVWVLTYGGPRMPSIHDGWQGGRPSENVIASSGIIVFRVDPRSASGKGARSAWSCYKQLGVQELRDLEEAVRWLGQNSWVDQSRVGISGHSYGGFLAAYALTHSTTFSAGIASGPVTDWKLYDTIYTERYMLTPKENPKGYRDSSCIAAAANLHGRLLIVHGMLDDNVHLQNSVQLAEALQASGKEFEMMFYPKARHGIGSEHCSKLRLAFIRKTMGVK